MLKICVLVSTFYTTIWALRFENCATSPLTTAFHWFQFDMYPLPVIFPGQLNMFMKIIILKNLTNPLVDTELYREDPDGGNAVQIPCATGTNVGTCQNIHLCTIIDRMNGKNETFSFQEQIEGILLTPLGNHIRCPILATPTTEKHAIIALQRLSPAVHKMLHGDYMLKISVKDNMAATDNIGCIKFNFTIADGPPTPPPTVTPEPTTTLTGPLPPDHPDVVG